jgi:hypothetical protein
MAKRKDKQALTIVGFNYDKLEPAARDVAKASAERIKAKVKKTLQDVIEIGNDLLAVKKALEHGHFGRWLKGEFGWGERMAQNLMSVAERFGPKSEIIADLTIQPTAAYLLAAPSVPDAAREKAVERAEAGEQITTAVAKKIVAQARKKRPRKRRSLPPEKLAERLLKVLEGYRERWEQGDLPELARQLREFADGLDGQKGGRKTK